MAKNNWDNRKLLAEAVVASFTPEECRSAAITSLMQRYDGNERSGRDLIHRSHDDRFNDDWFHHKMDEKLAETKEIKVLVVGNHAMRNLADVVAKVNHESPGSLRIIGEDTV